MLVGCLFMCLWQALIFYRWMFLMMVRTAVQCLMVRRQAQVAWSGLDGLLATQTDVGRGTDNQVLPVFTRQTSEGKK